MADELNTGFEFEYEEDNQGEDKEALAEQITMNFKEAFEHKTALGLMEDWATFEDYWAGRVNETGGEDHPASNTNIVHPIIESQVADLVDQPLDILLKGLEPSDQRYAKNTQALIDWVWKKNNPELKLDKAERQRLKFGGSVIKVWFDPYAFNDRGLPTFDPINPANFFPDPKIKDYLKMQDADFIIHAMPKSIKYLRQRYGEVAKMVEANAQYQYSPLIYEGSAADTSGESGKSQALLIEQWSKELDENDEWILRVVHMANGIILRDSFEDLQEEETGKISSYYENGKYPFVYIPCYSREGVLWGMGDVGLLKPIQDMINDLDDQIRMNARLMGNIQIVVGIATGINLKKWTNKPGLKIPARDPNSWKMVQPPTIPNHIPGRRQEGFKEAEIISGRSDIVEGRSGGSLRAASAVISMQEAGLRRVNHKRLLAQAGYKMVVELLLDYVKEFYTEEMAFRITGVEPTGTDNDFMWFKGSQLNNIPKLVPDYGAPLDDNQMLPLTELKDEEGNVMDKEAEFDIEVIVGTGLPNNKAFVYQATIELHREGVITNEEARMCLKELINWPIIDPMNPVGDYTGRNLSPEQMAMLNQGGGGMMGEPMVNDPMIQEQNLPPEIMNQVASIMGGPGI
ncbi:MAG: hypothetical protein M0Q14_10645 [Tissierellaceae bacterium]|nr:hypothetical protein [Tissierellaceae bacterium]